MILKKKFVYEEWAVEQYEKISTIFDISIDGIVDPGKLNTALLTFSQHFASMATAHQIEVSRLNAAKVKYDVEMGQLYTETEEHLLFIGKKATQNLIDSTITQRHRDKYLRLRNELDEQTSRAELIAAFVKALDKQATMLQAIAANMRSELFYTNGITLSTPMKGQASTAKSILSGIQTARKNRGQENGNESRTIQQES